MYLKTLRSVITENKRYLFAFLVLFTGALIIQLTFSQFSISVFINRHHHPVLDLFFKYVTHIGDGLFFCAVILLIFFFRRSYWLCSLMIFCLSSLLTQSLKRLVFSDMTRPAILMKDFPELHYIEGVYMNEMNSFPSGHTLSAFALFSFIAFMSREKNYALLFLLVAMVVAYSRIYLLQHFFRDAFAGSLLGVITSLLVFAAFENFKRKKTNV